MGHTPPSSQTNSYNKLCLVHSVKTYAILQCPNTMALFCNYNKYIYFLSMQDLFSFEYAKFFVQIRLSTWIIILHSCLSSPNIFFPQSISRHCQVTVPSTLTFHRRVTKTYKRQFLASPTECLTEELLWLAFSPTCSEALFTRSLSSGDVTFVPYCVN